MRIKAIRQEKGLTQVALAKRAKISPIYLAQIEGSAKNPPIRTPSFPMLEKLAKALKVTVGELVE
jgi:transcriptional regulator with XRE-family HTH domain